MAMQCEETRERVSELLEPGAAASGELSAHLAECAECRGVLERRRRTLQFAADAAPCPEPNPASWVKLADEMEEAHASWARRDRLKRRVLTALAFALPVLAALLWMAWKLVWR